tara:strand:+ start:1175 stop:2188 length:1014 start_codon:yes stop_codon:yes gene_type:complete
MNNLNTSLEFSHFPVLLNEIVKLCQTKQGGNFLDCTFGGGGYSKEILKIPNTKVTALDRDLFVSKFAKKLKKKYPKRFNFYTEKFSNLESTIKNQTFDVIIFDLGVSSFQIKDYSRGFSFKSNDKLDMCMGLSSLSAEYVINNFDEQDLKLIIKVFGDEKEASKIAKNIIIQRAINKISRVKELVKIIELSKKKDFKKKINISTKTFQALRIFVNKETTELIEGISKAAKYLKPDGKLIVVSFHSIEDKIVKFYFKNYSSNKSKPSRYLPEEKNEDQSLFKNYKNKIIKASSEELEKNHQSRSAKLRFAIRNNNKFLLPSEIKLKFKKYLEIEKIHA